MSKVKNIIIEADLAGQRLDNFLLNKLKGVPKSKIYSIIRKGEIRVNSKRKKPSYKILEKDNIRIPPIDISKREDKFIPSNIISILKESIIFENSDYIAINKPVGIASHGGSGISIGIIEAIRNFGKDYREAKLVHRLDKDTSGCQVIAKNNQFLRKCNSLISERQVKKTYQTVVHGNWTSRNEIFEINLEKNSLMGNERIVSVDKGGKIAKTKIKKIDSSKNHTLLKCELLTGRTHQLRVQLSFLNFPIVGDKKYGLKREPVNYGSSIPKRMYLHSDSFICNELKINLRTESPKEFKKILKNDD